MSKCKKAMYIFESGVIPTKLPPFDTRHNLTNLITKRNIFLRPTLYFLIAGFLMPGFTAAGFLGIQILLTNSGIECENAWTIIFRFATFGAIFLPFAFFFYIAGTLRRNQSAILKLIIFNIIEYAFIQACLVPFFTTGHTLCYVTDGQNGLELVFTAWLALPVLVLLSIVFDVIAKAKQKNQIIK